MNVKTIKTHKITKKDTDLYSILDRYVKDLKEGSVLAVTSKIVAITQGRMVQGTEKDKDELVKKEADWYLPRSSSKYNFMLSIKHNTIIASAGIDESNGDGYFILWPEDPQQVANEIRSYLQKRFKLKKVGVIITDSKILPLRWGVVGVAISHSGFAALNSYVGKPDIFGRKLKVERTNVAEALATASVVVMGEGKEQTPLAVISDLPFVKFQSRNPSKKELEMLSIEPEDDLYAPLLGNVKWKKGKK